MEPWELNEIYGERGAPGEDAQQVHDRMNCYGHGIEQSPEETRAIRRERRPSITKSPFQIRMDEIHTRNHVAAKRRYYAARAEYNRRNEA